MSAKCKCIPQSTPPGRRERRAAPSPRTPTPRPGTSSWWTLPTWCAGSSGGRCSLSCCCEDSLWNYGGGAGEINQTHGTLADVSSQFVRLAVYRSLLRLRLHYNYKSLPQTVYRSIIGTYLLVDNLNKIHMYHKDIKSFEPLTCEGTCWLVPWL